MTDPWQRARELARRQCDDEEIVGALVEDLAVEDDRASSIVAKGSASLLRARQAGRAALRERVWQLAHGDPDLAKTNGVQLAALQALARAHIGHGEPHDAAQLRELLTEGKRRAKGGRKLEAVS